MKKKSILLASASIILLFILTGCLKKKKDEILVKSSSSTIASFEDFKEMVSVLEKNESGLQFIPLLPQEEQEKIYLKLIEEYIVYSFLIKKYLEDNKINEKDDYKIEQKQYMKLMENNYNSAIFQKNLNDSIELNDQIAESYYLSNREITAEFMAAPFAKKTPGFEARAVRIEENTNFDSYKNRLKNNDNVIYLERINSTMRGTSQILIENLRTMKNDEYKEVVIENGMKFAVLKLNEHKGEWSEYKDVSEKVKNALRGKILKEKYDDTISSLKKKYEIEINEELVKNFIKTSSKKAEPSEKDLENAFDKISETIANEEVQGMEEDLVEELKKEIKDEIQSIATQDFKN